LASSSLRCVAEVWDASLFFLVTCFICLCVQSGYRERIYSIVEPLANVLGSIYFLCVGMVINIDWVSEHAISIGALVLSIAVVSIEHGSECKHSLRASLTFESLHACVPGQICYFHELRVGFPSPSRRRHCIAGHNFSGTDGRIFVGALPHLSCDVRNIPCWLICSCYFT